MTQVGQILTFQEPHGQVGGQQAPQQVPQQIPQPDPAQPMPQGSPQQVLQVDPAQQGMEQQIPLQPTLPQPTLPQPTVPLPTKSQAITHTPTGDPSLDLIGTQLAQVGVSLEAVMEQGFTPSTEAKLITAVGKGNASIYKAGIEQAVRAKVIAQANARQVLLQEQGLTQDAFNTMSSWVSGSQAVQSSTKQALSSMLSSGDPAVVKMAVSNVKSLYEASNVHNPMANLVQGDSAVGSAQAVGINRSDYLVQYSRARRAGNTSELARLDALASATMTKDPKGWLNKYAYRPAK